MRPKRTAREQSDRQADEPSTDEALYRRYVVQSVEKGLAEVDTVHLIVHEQVADALRRKWHIGSGE